MIKVDLFFNVIMMFEIDVSVMVKINLSWS